jgi:hypothetical protein
MDLSYATIPFFGGEHISFYREKHLAYIISDEGNPTNHPIYAVDTYLGSRILQLTDLPQSPVETRKPSPTSCEIVKQGAQTWKMYFDGASSKYSAGARVVFISLSRIHKFVFQIGILNHKHHCRT